MNMLFIFILFSQRDLEDPKLGNQKAKHIKPRKNKVAVNMPKRKDVVTFTICNKYSPVIWNE